MNLNYGSQHQGILIWTGGATPLATHVDIRKHVGFSFTFNVKAAIGADTLFKFESAPASAADPCVPGATWADVPEILICESGYAAVPAAAAQVLIPAGTPAGAICTATLPCKPNAFIRPVPIGGETADVQIVATLSGPR